MRTKETQKILVLSIDFDGCISPQAGSHDLKIPRLMEMMAEKLRADPDLLLILLNGSYRQSIKIDQYNLKRNKNGSCFQGLETLLTSFKIKFPDLMNRVSLDRFILEDIQNETVSGYHFKQAVILLTQYSELSYLMIKTRVDLSAWHDPEKRAQIYAQIHHVAGKFPQTAICFEQIDDLYEDILVPCNQFYAEQRFLIPNNVTYSQSHWKHGEPQPNTTEKIEGVGWIDFDYRENVLLLLSSAFDRWVFWRTIAQHQKLKLKMPKAFSYPKDRLRFFLSVIEIPGWTFIDKILRDMQSINPTSRNPLLLFEAVIEQNNAEILQKLSSITINIKDAALIQKWGVVEWLVNQNPADKSDYPYVLYQAILFRQTAVVEKLIAQMTPEMRVLHTEGNQRTVLQFAILHKNYDLLEKLLSGVTELSEKFKGACENAFNYAKSCNDQTAMNLLSPHVGHDEVFDAISESSFTM